MVISSQLSPEEKEAVLSQVGSLWPKIRLPRRDFARDSGVARPQQEFLGAHAHFAVDEEVQGEGDEMPESVAAELSKRFPLLTFAFVEVDCFGGHCDHAGSVWREGDVLHRVEFGDNESSHRRLLEHVGIVLPDDYFVPFRRGYFGDR
jgi:hypothetical protein